MNKKNFSAFNLRYLQTFAKVQGFTLIELLVVIVILSILASIALPAFAALANKAREVEATQNVGACRTAQKVHYIENSKFADSIDQLSIGIPKETDYYTYEIVVEENVQSTEISTFACCAALAKDTRLESFFQCDAI